MGFRVHPPPPQSKFLPALCWPQRIVMHVPRNCTWHIEQLRNRIPAQ